MDREELIKAVCEITFDKPEYYEDWSTLEIQELYLNLWGEL
jgi:hypothetical protein